MSRPARCAVVIGLALACGVGPAYAQEDAELRVSGYYKNLLLRSDTWTGERYTLDINRLRLELKGKLAPSVGFDIQYDNEILLGSYLRTNQFQQQKDQVPPQYWSAQANYVDRSALYGAHRLYRAQVQMAFGDTDVPLADSALPGEPVASGARWIYSIRSARWPWSARSVSASMRCWSSTSSDRCRAWRPSTRRAAYPARTVGLQWHDNARGLDFSFTGGRFRGSDVIGADLSGQIGQAGVRAELTRVRPREGKVFFRSLVGIDYAFTNTLTLSAELYRDGSGADSTAAYDFPALANGARQTLARRYVGLHAGYEMTPLLKLNTDIVVNLDDHSRVVAPSITYSIRANLDGSLGLRWFRGPTGSEYARVPDAAYLSLQWFF